MTKKYNPPFKEGELRSGCQRCIENVQGLLDSSLLLHKQKGGQYAAGLYMYAVEEFGKAILLKEYASENRKTYHIPAWILGDGNPTLESIAQDAILRKLLRNQIPNPSRLIAVNQKLRERLGQKISSSERKSIEKQLAQKITSHTAKLLIGFKILPTKCGKITGDVNISTAFHNNETFRTMTGGVVSMPAWTTGNFRDAINTDGDVEDANFDLKLKENCFYMDWNPSDKRSSI